MAKLPRWKREQQELLNANAELWDLLGRDPFGTRVTLTLLRIGIATPEALATGVEEMDSPSDEYVWESVTLDDAKGLGPVAMARIRERLQSAQEDA